MEQHCIQINREINSPGNNIAVCPPDIMAKMKAIERAKARYHEYDGLLERVHRGAPCGGGGGGGGTCPEPRQSCIYSNATGNSTCIGLSAFDVHVS
jgi:hypothetical protein